MRGDTNGLGGKIVVTGIGKLDEDEFLLTLLNEQVYLIHISPCSN